MIYNEYSFSLGENLFRVYLDLETCSIFRIIHWPFSALDCKNDTSYILNPRKSRQIPLVNKSNHKTKLSVKNVALKSIYPGPGRAVPVSKVQEHTLKSEQEHEPEAEPIPKIQSTEDLNGELPIGPTGKRRMFFNSHKQEKVLEAR